MKYLENKTIVVPFDFSESAAAAVDRAIELAEESTTIHVLYVVVPAPAFASYDPAIPMPPAFDQERSENSLAQMQKQFSDPKYGRIHFETVIGDAGWEIVAYANGLQADLVIISSHGRTGLNRLLVGSVTERVTRLAGCPVLVLRSHE